MGFLKCIVLLACVLGCAAAAVEDRILLHGKKGPGKGKRIVLVSGDEEYRSEQALPHASAMCSKECLRD